MVLKMVKVHIEVKLLRKVLGLVGVMRLVEVVG